MKTLLELRLLPWLAAGLLAVGAIACGDDGDGMMAGDDDDDDMMVGDDDDDMMVGDDDDDDDDDSPLLQAIAADDDLTSLAAALDELVSREILPAGILALLEAGEGPTVFAPTNTGFDAAASALGITDLSAATDEELTQLFGVIAYHIVADSLDAAAITDPGFPGQVPSLLGSTEPDAPDGAGVNLYFDLSEGVAIRYFGLDPADNTELTSSVTTPDVAVPGDDDAVIHKVDQVIVPPNVFRVGILEGLTGFVGAVEAADPVPGDTPTPIEVALADPEASYTAFVPNNDAFDGVTVPPDVLTGILLYHVVAGEDPVFSTTDPLPARADALNNVTLLLDIANGNVNGGSVTETAPGASITRTDIQAANGVIHVIDRILEVPTIATLAGIAGLDSLLTTVGQVDGDAGEGDPVIAGVLDNPLETLTVFAPTDMAFTDATGPGGPAAEADLDVLREALLYHVVQGQALTSDDLSASPTLDTLAEPGQEPVVNVAGDGTITLTDQAGQTIGLVDGLVDLRAVNGVVHVVDTVLLPLDL
jgi:uncharacterized surface protein with fasciclin (FAS1) repeats